jgi:hypothetical protein
MKARIVLAILVCLPLLNAYGGDEPASAGWRISPGAYFVRHFPGETFDNGYQFSGTSLLLNVRCFPSDASRLALTFGGGVAWYGLTGTPPIYSPMPTEGGMAFGVGSRLGRQDFTVFPLMAGAQFVLPVARGDKLLFYAGAEGNLNFISGRIEPNRQIEPGFSVLAGFTVQSVDLGIRYTQFSDMHHLGVHFGIRFHSFFTE